MANFASAIADKTAKSLEKAVQSNRTLAKGVANVIHVSNTALGRGGPIDEIIDEFLWLGNLYAAKDERTLSERGITHILGITQFAEVVKFLDERKFTYKIIELHDEVHCNLGQYFEETFIFIQSCLRDKGRIFVHCNQGRSRSATIVIAYLMRVNRWSYQQSLSFLQSKRPVCNPNDGFVQQLVYYEKELESFFGWNREEKVPQTRSKQQRSTSLNSSSHGKVAKERKSSTGSKKSDTSKIDTKNETSKNDNQGMIEKMMLQLTQQEQAIIQQIETTQQQLNTHPEKKDILLSFLQQLYAQKHQVEFQRQNLIGLVKPKSPRTEPAFGNNNMSSVRSDYANNTSGFGNNNMSGVRSEPGFGNSAFGNNNMPGVRSDYGNNTSGFGSGFRPTQFNGPANSGFNTDFSANSGFGSGSTGTSYYSSDFVPRTTTDPSSFFSSNFGGFTSVQSDPGIPQTAYQEDPLLSPVADSKSKRSSLPVPFFMSPVQESLSSSKSSQMPSDVSPSSSPRKYSASKELVIVGPEEDKSSTSFPQTDTSRVNGNPTKNPNPNQNTQTDNMKVRQQLYDMYFSVANVSKSGFLEGIEAQFFSRSKLSSQVLANIWDIVSIGQPRLGINQFYMALDLIGLVQNGIPPTTENIVKFNYQFLPVFE